MAGGIREAVQVQWINISYRSIAVLCAAAGLLIVGGGGSWIYSRHIGPRSRASAAIGRAVERLGEASREAGGAKNNELLSSAKVSLDQARREFGDRDFEQAKLAAIRSEGLSRQFLGSLAGAEKEGHSASIQRVEGDVRVKGAGEFSWRQATPGMVLDVGDQVKTSSRASVEVMYFDGTVTRVQPGTLLEIRDLYEDPVTKVRRIKEKVGWGEIEASTQKRNVSGSYHEVATDKVQARSEEATDFRVMYDPRQEISVVDVYKGQVAVSSAASRAAVGAGERISAAGNGTLSSKEGLPGVPRPLAPSDQRVFVFEEPLKEKLTLSWEPVAGAARYRLMIADRPLFAQTLYDAVRDGDRAVVAGVPPGDYHWRVAALSHADAPGPFSPTRTFRVVSQHLRDRSDTEPPRLEITEFVTVGQMAILNGQTEPGATVWVDGARVAVQEDGSFNAVVRLRAEGANQVSIVAQDGAGNEAKARRTAMVETY